MRLNRKAFTLIEVIVALGIAGGSLILLLSACRASLRRSQRAVESDRIEIVAQSKLDEIRCGAETLTRGMFPDLPDYEWNVTLETADVSAVKELKRIILVVKASSDSRVRQFAVLHYFKKVDPQ